MLIPDKKMDAGNLNLRMDSKTAKKLDWLARVSSWPKSMIVRVLIRKAQPRDLAIPDEDAMLLPKKPKNDLKNEP